MIYSWTVSNSFNPFILCYLQKKSALFWPFKGLVLTVIYGETDNPFQTGQSGLIIQNIICTKLRSSPYYTCDKGAYKDGCSENVSKPRSETF